VSDVIAEAGLPALFHSGQTGVGAGHLVGSDNYPYGGHCYDASLLGACQELG